MRARRPLRLEPVEAFMVSAVAVAASALVPAALALACAVIWSL